MSSKLSAFLFLLFGLLGGASPLASQEAPSGQNSDLGPNARWYELERVRGRSLPARIQLLNKPGLQIENTYHGGRFGVGQQSRVLIELQVSTRARQSGEPARTRQRQTVRLEGFYRPQGDTLVLSVSPPGSGEPEGGLGRLRSSEASRSIALPQGDKMYLRISNPEGDQPLLFTFRPTQ